MGRYIQIIKNKLRIRALKRSLAKGNFEYRNCFNLNMLIHEYPECTNDVLKFCKQWLLVPTCFWEAHEALGNIVRDNPGSAFKVLDIIKTGLQGKDIGRDALMSAYKAVGSVLKNNPQCAAKALKVIKVGLQSDQSDEVALYEAYGVLGNIAQIDKTVREEVLHIVLSDKEMPQADNLQNNKIWALANCLHSIRPDEAKARFSDQAELIYTSYNLRFCDKAEIDLLCEQYSLPQLNELNVGVYKKAKNAILQFEYLSQKEVDAGLDKELILHLNQSWIVPNAAALSLVYGKDFPAYLQKISAYNSYLQTRKSEIGTAKDVERQALREAKAAELTKRLQNNASKIKTNWQQVTETRQILDDADHENNEAAIIEAQKAYDEARTVLAANQCRQGSLVGTLKSVVGYVDYTNMQPISAEKATAWMIPVSKMENVREIRRCADKHMLGETPEYDKFIRFDMPNVKTEYNEETCQCIRTGQENTDVLSMVLQRYDMLKNDIGNKKFVEMAAIARALKWEGQDQEFCLANAEFLNSQQKYNEAENIYLLGKTVPSAFADKETVYSADGSWRCFVASKDDPRIICAGGNFGSKRASCCQSYDPGNVGSTCAVDSIINPDSGCLVFEKQDKSGNWEMLGCSWFYRTQNQDMKNLTFDNVEINSSVCQQDAKQTQEVFFKMVDQFKNDNYRQITIGSSPDLMLEGSKYRLAQTKPQLPEGYAGYTDAHRQWVLYDNPRATPEKLPEHSKEQNDLLAKLLKSASNFTGH